MDVFLTPLQISDRNTRFFSHRQRENRKISRTTNNSYICLQIHSVIADKCEIINRHNRQKRINTEKLILPKHTKIKKEKSKNRKSGKSKTPRKNKDSRNICDTRNSIAIIIIIRYQQSEPFLPVKLQEVPPNLLDIQLHP